MESHRLRTTALWQSPVLQAHDLYTAFIWVTTIVVTLLVATTKFLTEQLEDQAREIGTLNPQAPRPELEPAREVVLCYWGIRVPHTNPTVGTNKYIFLKR